MYIKPEKYRWDKGDRIPRGSNRAKRNQNRKRKDKRSIRLADSPKSQKYTEVLKIGQLLSIIH